MGVQEITGAVASVDAAIVALGAALSAEIQEIVAGLATVDASVLSLVPVLSAGFAAVTAAVTASQTAVVAELSTLIGAVNVLPTAIATQTTNLTTAMTTQASRIVDSVNLYSRGIPFNTGSVIRMLRRLSSANTQSAFSVVSYTKTGSVINIFTLFWDFTLSGSTARFVGAGTSNSGPNERPNPQLLVPMTLPYSCVMMLNSTLYDVVILSIT